MRSSGFGFRVSSAQSLSVKASVQACVAQYSEDQGLHF